eukprot:CAMPEP_0197430810 /NCGR_PEP_ID=MMETSP1170-20131217/52856_1 /TAXON_ID=54406 /ORGANISM="Sarcinochrysis sp, Strain CCMP770" /LENGTH=130 /DNA_ID=CAMNT_0042958737 /DNA_START=121 /DNA_END=514 /DNA_ORIENTATION=+
MVGIPSEDLASRRRGPESQASFPIATRADAAAEGPGTSCRDARSCSEPRRPAEKPASADDFKLAPTLPTPPELKLCAGERSLGGKRPPKILSQPPTLPTPPELKLGTEDRSLGGKEPPRILNQLPRPCFR